MPVSSGAFIRAGTLLPYNRSELSATTTSPGRAKAQAIVLQMHLVTMGTAMGLGFGRPHSLDVAFGFLEARLERLISDRLDLGIRLGNVL